MEHNEDKPLVSFLVVATGPYNQFIPKLIASAVINLKFEYEIVVFTDRPHQYPYPNVKVVEVEHLGWPRMPLLRFELFSKHLDKINGEYAFSMDAEARVVDEIRSHELVEERVGTLHRNIMRPRSQFNYESREESTAYIAENEGEQYFAGGFIGGTKEEFGNIARALTKNIRADIQNGIRAIWGDESHINRYFIDNKPTKILPPNYMCAVGNAYLIPKIIHDDKDFKNVYVADVKKHTTINPKDYEI